MCGGGETLSPRPFPRSYRVVFVHGVAWTPPFIVHCLGQGNPGLWRSPLKLFPAERGLRPPPPPPQKPPLNPFLPTLSLDPSCQALQVPSRCPLGFTMMNDLFIHSFIQGDLEVGCSWDPPHGGPSCIPPKGKCLPQAPHLIRALWGATATSLPCQS